jgi:protein-L-isoaspartate(D-aspartate) O-methyltransferase
MTPDAARERMIDLLTERGISDDRVLRAMAAVPRHEFVDARLRADAYADGPLPIGHGQTISQPYIVALMSEALGVGRGDKVLEIGTGSGYQAAVLAEMGVDVYSIECVDVLASDARRRLRALGYDRVRIRCADGNDGWPDAAPYDAVVIAAAAREVLRGPYSQLREGGCMVFPIGGEENQELVVIRREAGGPREEYLGACRFVKLIGRHGWVK